MATSFHIRVDEEVKARAAESLAAMGLTLSDAVRMMLERVAAEHRLPFEPVQRKAPNLETRAAIQELEEGRGDGAARLAPCWRN